ncbi:MAG: TRAP transporter small permease subunit [Saprospiraceae bacterium]|nr:TRAP transporter small permease subunit [Saprospiraceae bacterium]
MNLIELNTKLISFTGKLSAWLNPLLVIIICIDVILRYIFNISSNWVIELEWHLFGLIFLWGSAYALQLDKHVRVDLFYAKMSEKNKNIIDILGSILFLIPWCIVGIITCFNYASNSFYIRENSPNPDGLPALYFIKYMIVFCFILLLLQGIVTAFEKINRLKKI